MAWVVSRGSGVRVGTPLPEPKGRPGESGNRMGWCTAGVPRGGVGGVGRPPVMARFSLSATVGRSCSQRQAVSLAARSTAARSSAVWKRLAGSLARAW